MASANVSTVELLTRSVSVLGEALRSDFEVRDIALRRETRLRRARWQIFWSAGELPGVGAKGRERGGTGNRIDRRKKKNLKVD